MNPSEDRLHCRTASIPAMCQASLGVSSQPCSLSTSMAVSSLPAGLLLLPASLGKPSWWQIHTLTLRPAGNWPNHPWGTEFTYAWLKSSLLLNAFTLSVPERSILWGYPSGKDVLESQPVLLSTCAFLLNAQVSSRVSQVDYSIYWWAAAENQHIFESTLRVSWPSFRPLFTPRPPTSFSTDLHQDTLSLVPSMLCLNPLPQLLSHSTCSCVGGYICTFINTFIMPHGLADGAALWIWTEPASESTALHWISMLWEIIPQKCSALSWSTSYDQGNSRAPTTTTSV